MGGQPSKNEGNEGCASLVAPGESARSLFSLLQSHTPGSDGLNTARLCKGAGLPQLLPWALPSSGRLFSTLLPPVKSTGRNRDPLVTETQSRSDTVNKGNTAQALGNWVAYSGRGRGPIRGSHGTSFSVLKSGLSKSQQEHGHFYIVSQVGKGRW